MLLVFLNGELAGLPSPALEKAAKLGVAIEAFGTFHGAMTTWHPPEPGMSEAGVTKRVVLQHFEPVKK